MVQTDQTQRNHSTVQHQLRLPEELIAHEH